MNVIYNAEGQTPEQFADGFLNFTARNAQRRRYPGGMAERLALFSEWTGAPLFPVEDVIEETEDGRTFTTAFLTYCGSNGLSIDWAWLGDERSLVIGAYNAAKEGSA